jgi:hypothetical protein
LIENIKKLREKVKSLPSDEALQLIMKFTQIKKRADIRNVKASCVFGISLMGANLVVVLLTTYLFSDLEDTRRLWFPIVGSILNLFFTLPRYILKMKESHGIVNKELKDLL